MHFALIHEALFMIVQKFDRVFDRNHMLFALAVDLVEHGRKRRRFSRAGRTSDQHQATRFVAEGFHYNWQAEGVEALDLPGDRPENRSDRATLLEQVAAEARQILQAKRKIELEILLEPVLLGIGEHAVGPRLRNGRRTAAR